MEPLNKKVFLKTVVEDLKSADPLRISRAQSAMDNYRATGVLPTPKSANLFPDENKTALTWKKMADTPRPNTAPKKKSIHDVLNETRAAAHYTNNITSSLDRFNPGNALQNTGDFTGKFSKLTTLSDLLKQADESLLENDPEKRIKSITKAQTFISNHKGQFTNIKEVDDIESTIDMAALKDAGITDLNAFRQSLAEFYKLPAAQQKNHPMLKTIAAVGAARSRYMEGSAFYEDKQYRKFGEVLKKPRASWADDKDLIGRVGQDYNPNVVFSQALHNADAVIQHVLVKDANKALEKEASKLGTQYEALNKEYELIRANVDTKSQASVDAANAKLKELQQTAAKLETQEKDLYRQMDENISLFEKQKKLILNNYDKREREGIGEQTQLIDKYAKAIDDVMSYATFPSLSPKDPTDNPSDASRRLVTMLNNIPKKAFNSLVATIGGISGTPLDSYKADKRNEEIAWNTGEIDRYGNPVLSNVTSWEDHKGEKHYQPGNVLETGLFQAAHTYLSGALTKGIAGALTIGAKFAGKAFSATSAAGSTLRGLSAKQLLNAGATVNGTKITLGARALTFPAVYASSYGMTYYDNVGKFKTEKEMKEYVKTMSVFEAFTESIVPDVFFFDSASLAKVGAALDASDFARLKSVLKGATTGTAKKELIKKFAHTLKLTSLKTFQEALVEEEINYLAGAAYEDKKLLSEGEENYKRQGEKLSLEETEKLGIESMLTMSVSMLMGMPGDYRAVSKKYGYDFTKPENLDYHRYNIATNANAMREQIAKDDTFTPEQKHKAFEIIAANEQMFKVAASAVTKPDQTTLKNDDESVFMYFKALSDKSTLELKVAEKTASKEEVVKFEKAETVLATLDKAENDWQNLSPEKRQEKWFSWFEGSVMDTEYSGLSNSPAVQVHNLFGRRDVIVDLFKSDKIDQETYERYKKSFENIHKKIQATAKENIDNNLANIDALTPEQLDILQEDLKAYMMLSNNSQVEGVTESNVIKRDESEIGRNLVFRKRLFGMTQEDDKIKVVATSRNGISKEVTLVNNNGKFVIEGTVQELDKTDFIDSAVIVTPTFGENTNYKESLAYVRKAAAKIQEKRAGTAAPAPVQRTPHKWGDILAIENPSERNRAIVKAVSESQDKQADIADIERFKQNNPALTEGMVKMADTIIKRLGRQPKASAEETTSRQEEVIIPEELPMPEEPIERIPQPVPEAPKTDEAEAPVEYSDDHRPTSAFITISDEFDRNNKKSSDWITAPINKFLRMYGDDINNFKGKLMSSTRFLKQMGVSIDAVKATLAEYWALPKEERTKKVVQEYTSKLMDLMPGVMPVEQVQWLLEDDTISAVNSEVYGLTDNSKKFETVTLRSFQLVLFDSNVEILKIDNTGKVSPKGHIAVTRNMPKVSEDGYFYNIKPLDAEGIRQQAMEVRIFQDMFLDEQDMEKEVGDLRISRGFEATDYTKAKPTGVVQVQTVNNPLTKREKGYAYDNNGNKVYTLPIAVEDRRAIATLLKSKEPWANAYINSLVFLTDELKQELAKMSLTEIEETLEGFHYNIHNKSLVNKTPIEHVTVKGGVIERAPAVSYETFMASKWYTISYNHKVDENGNAIEGNRKIYFNPIDSTNEPVEDTSLFEMPTADPNELAEDFEQQAEQDNILEEETQKVNETLLDIERPKTEPTESAPAEDEEIPWEYSKENSPVSASSWQELEAYHWFQKSFLSKGIGFNYRFTSNPTAFASFTNAAITLYRGSNFTDLYHESWHRFTQNFLTKEEKAELYAALKSTFSDEEYVPQDAEVLEEALAEAFRSLQKSGGKAMTITIAGKTSTISMQAPAKKEQGFIAKIKALWNFLTSFAGNREETANDIIRKYMLEASNSKSVRTSDPRNAMFRKLNISKGKTLVVDGQEVNLDYASLHELNQGIDALFVNYFNELKKPNEDGKSRMSKEATFTAFANQPKEARNKVAELIYGKVKNHIAALGEKETDPVKKLEYRAVVENFNVFKEESGGLRDPFKNSHKEAVAEELEALENEETRIEIAEVYETKLSQQELAAESILSLVRMIPVTDKKGKMLQSINWRLPYLGDFGVNWLILANNLSGLTYDEMLDTLQEMANTTHPQFRFLLENLPGKEIPVSAPYSSFGLRVQFEQVFNMPKVTEMITILGTDADGKMVIKFTEAGTSSTRTVIDNWQNESEDLPYTLSLEEYPNSEDLNTVDNILDFLELLGIVYENRDIVKDTLAKNKRKENDFSNAAVNIHEYLTLLKKNNVQMDNSIAAIKVERKNLKSNGKFVNRKNEDKSLKFLANLEVETNQEIADDMMLRADGEKAWKFNQYNYLTKITRDMDTMPYAELRKLYPQLDIAKNPAILNSPWFSALFEVSEDNVVTRKQSSALTFIKTGGLKSEELDESQGTLTVDLTATDKLAMDFYSYVTAGIEENVKFGDKTTAGAMKLEGLEKVGVLELDKLYDRLFDQLIGEVATIQRHNSIKVSDNSKQYKYTETKKKDKYTFFRTMLVGEDMKPDLDLKLALEASKLVFANGKWTIEDKDLKAKAIEAMKMHFENTVLSDSPESFKSRIQKAYHNGVVPIPDLYDKVTDQKVEYAAEDVMMWYYLNSVSSRIDQFTLLYGDPRNYKNGSDVFKRLSAYSATGKFPSLAEDNFKRLNAEGRKVEAMYSNSNRLFSSRFNVVQFENMPVNLDPKMLSEQLPENLKKAWNDYIKESNGEDKGDKADASGAVTIDFYKAINVLIGTWDNKQEAAYNDQVEFLKAKKALLASETARPAYIKAKARAQASYADLLVVFNPKKWQYAGSIYSDNTSAADIDMRAFLKFSIMPIIPSNVEGTELEKIAENMAITNTDMYVFSSGSKMTWDQKNQDFNVWATKTITSHEDPVTKKKGFTPTVLDLNNFKEQLPIENKMKEEGIFASQMRKLLSVGLYENGKSTRNVEDYERYKQAVENITNLVKQDILKRINTPEKLISYLREEFDKRDMPEHVKDFLLFYEQTGNIVNALDTSFQSFFIQNVIFSVVNNKLIKQKYKGGQFVQLPNAGYRKANFLENDKYKAGELKFYETPVDENGVQQNTRSMQIKIAFSKKYEPLLNIVWNGERIGSKDKLNSLLRDEAFIKEHGKKFTMIGCRIPVQGFSTIESMIVAEFLDPIAGQVVIVPDGLTIKSGSDFDIDKLNIYEPHLDRDGNLVDHDISIDDDILEIREELFDDNERLKKEQEERREQMANETEAFKATDTYAEIMDALNKVDEDAPADLSLLANLGTVKYSSKEQAKPVEKSKDKQELEKLKAQADEKGKSHTEKMTAILAEVRSRQILISKNNYMIKSLVDSEINTLLSSVSNIILDKANAENLLTKNELDYIEAAYVGLGIRTKQESTMDISEIIDVISSNKVTENNNSAKKSLGIAAKSNPLYAMFLEAGMKVYGGLATSMGENRDGNVLSLSSLYTQPYKGNNPKYKDHKGPMYIPKLLSEYISATVDVANDNRVGDPRFNFNKFLAPLYIYGVMRGTHLFELTDMMSMPSIQEFIKGYMQKDSIIYQHHIQTTEKEPKVRKALLSKRAYASKAIKDSVYKNYHVLDSNKNFDHIATAENIIKHKDEIGADAVALANFITLLEDSNHLTELSTAVSWDTNTSKSFVEFEYGNHQLEKLHDEGFFDSEAISKIRYDSVIAPLNVNDFVQENFSPLFSVIATPEFKKRAIDMYSITNRVPLENFTRDFTNDFFTYLFQTHAMYEGELAYPTFISSGMMDKNIPEDNIEGTFLAAIEAAKGTGIETNTFIKALKFKKTRSSDFIAPILKNSNVDVHTQNLYHLDLLKLLNSNYSPDGAVNAQIQQATRELILSTALLNGVNKTFASFIEILPTDVYTETLRNVVSKGITAEMYDAFERRFIVNRKTKYFKDITDTYIQELYEGEEVPKVDSVHKYNYFIPQENTVSLQEPMNIYYTANENVELSNFAKRPATYNTAYVEGFFETPEAAFQAAKFRYTAHYFRSPYNLDPEEIKLIKRLRTATGAEAKKIGRSVKELNTKEWDKDSSDIMTDILIDSFRQNPDALAKLLATGDAELTHTQDKSKWGTEFPRILMEVRKQLREESKEPAKIDLKAIALNNKGKRVSVHYDKYKTPFNAIVTGEVELVVGPTTITYPDGRVKVKDDAVYDIQIETSTGKILTAKLYEITGLDMTNNNQDESNSNIPPCLV